MSLFTCVKHCPAFIFASFRLFLEKYTREYTISKSLFQNESTVNVYAGFIVRNNKSFFVSLPVFVIQLTLLARSLKEEIWKLICTANIVT